MSKSRYNPEKIIHKMRKSEVLISQSITTPEVVISTTQKIIPYAT